MQLCRHPHKLLTIHN